MSVKVLLADSSTSIHKVVELALAERSVELTTASDGNTALEQAKALVPDVVLADIELPRIDGYALCERIKADPALAATRVVLLKTSFASYDEDRAAAAGADGMLEKPFSAGALIKIVDLQGESGAEEPAVEPTVQEPPPLEEAPAEDGPEPTPLTVDVSDDSSFADLEVGEEGIGTETGEPGDHEEPNSEEIILDLEEDEGAPEGEAVELSIESPQEPPAGEAEEAEGPELRIVEGIDEGAEIELAEPEPAEPEATEAAGEEALAEIEEPVQLVADSEPEDISTGEEVISVESRAAGEGDLGAEPFELEEPAAEPEGPEASDVEMLVEKVTERVLQRLRVKSDMDDEESAREGRDLIEEIVKRLSDDVIREIAWEVVPDLAERMIKKALDEITQE